MEDSETSHDFMALAAKLPATVRGLLIDQVDPLTISVDSLLKDLRVDPERHLLGELSAHVMSIRSALPDGACETLRAAVDDESNRSVKKDSVDGGSAHELVLDLASLTALIGHAAARELCLLPARYAEWQRHPRPLVPAVPAEIFVRRYSSDTRPWINFHADAYSTTINIALDSSTTHEGGSLVAVADGKVRTIERRQGEATVHDSRLLHAVTSIRGARIRHSLILFFGQRRRREENETAEQEEEEEALAPQPDDPVERARLALSAAADAVDAACRAQMDVGVTAGRTDGRPAADEFVALLPYAHRLLDALVLAEQRAMPEQRAAGPVDDSLPQTLAMRASSLRQRGLQPSLSVGARVQLTGLSNPALNGTFGRIADENPPFNGERYKVDAEAASQMSEAHSCSPTPEQHGAAHGNIDTAMRVEAPQRMLVKPRNLCSAQPLLMPRTLPPASSETERRSDGASAEELDEWEPYVTAQAEAVDVRLRLSPSMLPPANDKLRWQTLSMLGLEVPSGGAAPSLVAMPTFELSADDWRAYGHLHTSTWGEAALATDAARATAAADEPARLKALKLFALLLVAPTTALAHFLARGALPSGAGTQLGGGGPLGRCLVAMVDFCRLGGMNENGSSADSGRADRQLSRWREAFCRQYAVPLEDGPSPVACWSRTLLRALSCAPMDDAAWASPPDVTAVAEKASAALRSGSAAVTHALPLHIEAGWLHGAALDALRAEALAFVRARCVRAGVGPAEVVDTSVRRCAATDLLGARTADTLPPALLALTWLVDRLRVELSARCAVPLLDVAELQLLLYPPGGHYRRHVDSAKGSVRQVRRAFSLLLYLTPDEWDASADGGALRVYAPDADGRGGSPEDGASAALMDVPPTAGSLLIFDSGAVPHQVLSTRRERLCVAGWLCVQ